MFFNSTINKSKTKRIIADHCNKIGLMFSEHDDGVFIRHPHSGGFWIALDKDFLRQKARVYQSQFSNVRFMAPLLLYKKVSKKQITDILDRFKAMRMGDYLTNIPSRFTMHLTLTNIGKVDVAKTLQRNSNPITRKVTYTNRYACLSFFSNHSVSSRKLTVKYRREDNLVTLSSIGGCESLHPLEVVSVIDKIISSESPGERTRVVIDPTILPIETLWALDWVNTQMAQEWLKNTFVHKSDNMSDLYPNGSYRTITRKDTHDEETYTTNLALFSSLTQS